MGTARAGPGHLLRSDDSELTPPGQPPTVNPFMSEAIDAILDFAITQEQESIDLYTNLAARSGDKYGRAFLEELIAEETGHKATLERVKSGGANLSVGTEPVRLETSRHHMADRIHVPANKDDLSYEDALGIALKKETASFLLYQDLAATAEDKDLKETFLSLARKEAAHKTRFEIIFADYFLD